MRALSVLVAGALVIGGGALAAAEDRAPVTADQWLESRHVVFRRYLNMVRQAQHDYENGYPTPRLIVVLARDLFVAYVAHVHQVEHQVLYPVALARLPDSKRQTIDVLRKEIQREFSTARDLQRAWEAYDGAPASPKLAEVLDAMARLVNRHIVLQEETVFPVLYALKSEEHAALLRQLESVELKFSPPGGRARALQALDYIEDRIRIDSPRKW